MANAFFLPPLPIAAAFAPSTAAGHDPLFVGNDHAGVVWKAASAAGTDLVLDLGVDRAVDTIMLFGVEGATAGTTLQVIWSTAAAGPGFAPFTGADAPVPLLAGALLPESGRGVALWQAPATLPACRYWLLRIAGAAAPITIGRAVIGTRFQPERNFAYGAAFGVRDLGTADINRRGVLLRSRGRKLRTVGLSFPGLRKDEVEASTLPLMERVGNTECVALVTDPAPHAQRQRRSYFGPLVGDLSHAWRNAAAWEARANLVSLF